MSFLSELACLPTPSRPNTKVLFQLVDASKPRLSHTSSPFIIDSWSQLLLPYPDPDLRIHLVMLLYFDCLLGYTGPETMILSSNLPSALIEPSVIDHKLAQDLSMGRVIEITDPISPFISSPLGLVPKHDGSLRRIYYHTPVGDPSMTTLLTKPPHCHTPPYRGFFQRFWPLEGTPC